MCGGVQGGCVVGQGLGECGDGGSELDNRLALDGLNIGSFDGGILG